MAGARMGGALRQIHHLFVEGTVAGLPDDQLLERFLARGDGAAFAALVERHGPMVLGTCRSVLRHPEGVEDAFQATFLVLVCKAPSIRGQAALGSWLRQVAHRVAVRAGVESARRRACERRAGAGRAADPHRAEPDDDWRRCCTRTGPALGQVSPPGAPLRPGGQDARPGRGRAGLRAGDRAAAARRRLALLRSRLARRGDRADGRGPRRHPRPLRRRAGPPAWIEAAVAAAHRSPRERPGWPSARSSRRRPRPWRSVHQEHDPGPVEGDRRPVIALIALGGITWGVGAAGPDEPKAGRPGPAPAGSQAMMPGGPRSADPSRPGRRRPTPGEPHLPRPRRRSADDPSRGPRSTWSARPRSLDVPDGPRDQRAGWWFPFRGPCQGLHRRAVEATTGCRQSRGPGLGLRVSAWPTMAMPTSESTLTIARDDAPIVGRVVNLEGRPVAGVSVKVMEVRLSIAGRTFGDEVAITALKALNAVRPVSDSYARSIQVAIAEQLDSSQKGLEERKEWDTLGSPILPNRVASATVPRSSPTRRPVPTAGSGSPGSAAGGSPRSSSTGRRSRPRVSMPDLAGSPDPPPCSTKSPFVRALDGLRRDVRARRRSHPGDRRRRPRPPDRTPAGRYPGLRLAILRAPGLRRPDDDRRPGEIPARRAAARRGQAGGRPGLRLQRRPELVRDRSPAPGGSVPALLRVASAGRKTTGQGAGPPRHRPGPGSPRHRPDHRQGHREARARRISYFAFDDNPHRKASTDPARQSNMHFTDAEGVFRLVIPPGPGVLAAYVFFGPYVRAAGVDAIKDRRGLAGAHR